MDIALIVLFARHFGWTLEDIGKLGKKQATELANELIYQIEVDEYKQKTMMAFYISLLCGAITGKVPDLEEAIGLPPLRANTKLTEEYLLAKAAETRKRRRDEHTG